MAYLLVTLVIALSPGAFLSMSIHMVREKFKLLLAVCLSLVLVLVTLISKEGAIVLSIGILGGLYYLDRQPKEIKENLVDDIGAEIKKYWPYLPKRTRDRIYAEKDIARMVEEMNEEFTVPQVYAVMERAYGKRVKETEPQLMKEIKSWASDLKKERRDGETYYKFKGGKK